MKKARVLAFLIVVACAPAAWGNTVSGSQTLSLNLSEIGKVQVVQSSVTLTHTGTTFADFTGSESLNFKIRTTISTGSAALVVKATANFSPANGPSVSNSDLTYTCSGSNFSPCSGTLTMSTGSNTNVVTMGAGVCVGTGCAGLDPSSVTMSLDLVDKPGFKTGSYSATLTFSFSLL